MDATNAAAEKKGAEAGTKSETGKPLIRMYSDFKSPYAYLAFEPGLDLSERYDVDVQWMPFQLRQRGAGERSKYSEFKYQYSWVDVRRAGKSRGLQFEPPAKVYDTTPALIGGLYAQRHGVLREYGVEVFRRFFAGDFEADRAEPVAELLSRLGLSGDSFLDYLSNAGLQDFAQTVQDALDDKVFGVPFFVLDNEHFWGNDRLPLLERRLREKGLARENVISLAAASTSRAA